MRVAVPLARSIQEATHVRAPVQVPARTHQAAPFRPSEGSADDLVARRGRSVLDADAGDSRQHDRQRRLCRRRPGRLAVDAGRDVPLAPRARRRHGLDRPLPAQPARAGLAGRGVGLHELAVEDAILAHQRPKIERYDDTLFVVLRAAWYVDETEDIDFGELHLFIGPDFVLTVRHGAQPDLSPVRRRMESNPDLLRLGPEAVLYAILDRVVDGYGPVVAGLANDIDEIETEMFRGDTQVSRRIYELSREVVEFQRATRPLLGVVRSLAAGFSKYRTDEELQRYLRDVEDHVINTVEQIDEFRNLLRDILTVNATLVAQQQNEEMKALSELSVQQNDEVKKISGWAAILFAPTLVGTVYGMNFEFMPELQWRYGYFMALGLMLTVNVVLYILFRRRNWI
ncbi:magnesium and cobalt transport protein CorA [Nocardioides turkmenicus]|uniref:magnesium and cobalt transport protein CorA n=1 Tax=Nocardioides turkmenicus TaxID=2711220 RepID=UPI0030B9E2AE